MTTQVLSGGTIVDGTGADRFRADVTVSEGIITEIAPPGTSESLGPRIDVTGLVVAPGFIDMHAHSDLAVVNDPEHTAKVWQGVTCEVLGQDGLSYAPVTDQTLPQIVSQIAGWNGEPDVAPEWRTVAQYLATVDRGAPVNVAYLVPHGNVRMEVLGTEQRAPTVDELQRMIAIVTQGLADGAAGLSTGLTYTPGMYADDDEIVALCGPVRDAGGYYCPHHRNYGRSVVQGYQDCLSIAKCADVALHLAHCHVNYLQNAGRAIEVLDAIDAAVAQDGLDVSLDSYPYLAGATYLAALLPSWVHAGGADAVVSRLQDPETRRRILYEIEVSGSDGSHNMPVDWTTISVSGVADERSAWAVGATIAELASARDEEPGALFCNLLVADRLGVGCLVHVGNEDNVRAIMRHRAHTAGSDGILVGARPHPRGWGTFPRYLGTYVRELGILRLEECVAHLTSRPARRLRMVDRGVLRVGAVADIVVFDADTIDATGTYDDPRRQPQGIQHVMVNGEYTLRDGHRTDRLPGRAIRRA
ncbi:MAG TPA: D-aminoacylase [Acidothermaceae bacterium]